MTFFNQMDTNPVWHIIFNPHAGSGKAKKDEQKILKLIAEYLPHHNIFYTEYPEHAVELGKILSENGATHFIVAGGDGTLNEVVNGIFSRNNQYHDVVIGMIPVGTGNDWIKTFGIPDDYEKALQHIAKMKTIVQDMGEITYKQLSEDKKRYFINIAGFGFDGLVTSNANNLKAKGIGGFRVYLSSLFSSYLKFKAKNTLLEIDGKRIEKKLFSISVGIGKFNGGGMMQVPGANPVKGVFNITTIDEIGIAGILRNFRGLYTGKFIHDRRVSTYTGKNVIIQAEEPLPGEADGESLGESHFHLTILPHQLKVICGDATF